MRVILAAIALPCTLAWANAATAAPATQPNTLERPRVVETTFKSVDATIAAQWDFPTRSPAPLVILIPASGSLDRDGLPPGTPQSGGDGIYAQFADKLVEHGFAVFRFDKPGTGKSSRGHYNTPRSDALEAYGAAIKHARVDLDNLYLLGHSYGTDAVAGIYSRYQSVAPPAGVILLSNRVGETQVVKIVAPTLIVVGEKNPDDLYQRGRFAAEARDNVEDNPLETKLVTIPEAGHALLTEAETGSSKAISLDPRAVQAVLDWLMEQVSKRARAAR